MSLPSFFPREHLNNLTMRHEMKLKNTKSTSIVLVIFFLLCESEVKSPTKLNFSLSYSLHGHAAVSIDVSNAGVENSERVQKNSIKIH